MRTVKIVLPLRGGEVTGTIEVRIGGVRRAVVEPPMSAADDEPPFPKRSWPP